MSPAETDRAFSRRSVFAVVRGKRASGYCSGGFVYLSS